MVICVVLEELTSESQFFIGTFVDRFLNGLGVADASLVLTTDAVLMRVVGMLQTLHCVAVSAHHITA